ncbi:MAG: hypothetical protein Q7U53_02535 [Anaerolineaceae bacterium]|nr:hypothetical protein [Anaerolineaceae bacterium]
MENLLLAARAQGYQGEVTLPNHLSELISVKLTAISVYIDPLVQYIPLRQNTRSEYLSEMIKIEAIRKVQATSLEPGTGLEFILNPGRMESVIEYVNTGNLQQYANPAFVQELIYWLRFNEREALASMDGLFSRCSGNPTVPRLLGKMFVSGTKPAKQVDSDAKKLRSSIGAVILTSEKDDRASWVKVGRLYQRLALNMTTYEIKSALLNQPIEVSEIRPQFQSAMNLGEKIPQLLVRFGYAPGMPKSLRRPIEQVLI